jgi:hypothetical protein
VGGPDPTSILFARLAGVPPLFFVHILAATTAAYSLGYGFDILCLAVFMNVGPCVLNDAILRVFKSPPTRQLHRWSPSILGGVRGSDRGGRGRGGGRSQSRTRPVKCHPAPVVPNCLGGSRRRLARLTNFPGRWRSFLQAISPAVPR